MERAQPDVRSWASVAESVKLGEQVDSMCNAIDGLVLGWWEIALTSELETEHSHTICVQCFHHPAHITFCMKTGWKPSGCGA